MQHHIKYRRDLIQIKYIPGKRCVLNVRAPDSSLLSVLCWLQLLSCCVVDATATASNKCIQWFLSIKNVIIIFNIGRFCHVDLSGGNREDRSG